MGILFLGNCSSHRLSFRSPALRAMILNDELEARNDNEIVMREIDPKTLSVMFTTSTPGNSLRMTWTSR